MSESWRKPGVITPGQGPGRGTGRRFKPGNRGKPKGARSRAAVLLEALLAQGADGVAEAVVAAARNGDMLAARLVLDRACPAPRGRPVAFELPPVESAADLGAAQAVVTAAVAAGTLTPEEGATVAGMLEARRRTFETVELDRRVAQLEGRLSHD